MMLKTIIFNEISCLTWVRSTAFLKCQLQFLYGTSLKGHQVGNYGYFPVKDPVFRTKLNAG